MIMRTKCFNFEALYLECKSRNFALSNYNAGVSFFLLFKVYNLLYLKENTEHVVHNYTSYIYETDPLSGFLLNRSFSSHNLL